MAISIQTCVFPKFRDRHRYINQTVAPFSPSHSIRSSRNNRILAPLAAKVLKDSTARPNMHLSLMLTAFVAAAAAVPVNNGMKAVHFCHFGLLFIPDENAHMDSFLQSHSKYPVPSLFRAFSLSSPSPFHFFLSLRKVPYFTPTHPTSQRRGIGKA